MKPPPQHAHIDQVTAAIQAVKGDLSSPSDLAWLAGTVPFSRFHFHRVFRDTTGVTPARFLAAARMAESRRLLMHSTRTVAAISAQVGYNSISTFTTQFTRLVGLSPERFRRVGRLLFGDAGVRFGGAVQLPRPDAVRAAKIRADVPGSAEDLLVVSWRPADGGRERERCLVARMGLAHVPLPADGRAYRVRVMRVRCGETVAALVDERWDCYRIGWTTLQPRDHAEPVTVRLRTPRSIDPPLVSADPLVLILRSQGAGLTLRELGVCVGD
jgi:AraC-like DNA-binding protein